MLYRKSFQRRKKQQLEQELESLSFSCDSYFQDIGDSGEYYVVIDVYVNIELTCQSPIEVPYYAVFDDPLCFYLLW